ncbi:MAG: 4Fe-4S binding protein [Candidatus Helarchaeota archaeon]|nr:4Fe-4S binding protein [Candidatus Helarchaeota archaeon]
MDLFLLFPLDIAYKPMLANIILETGIPINFISINIDAEGGDGIISVPDDKVNEITKILKDRGFQVLSKRHVVLDKNLCIECGGCVGLCYVDALRLDPETFSLIYEEEKCVFCKNCLDACPRRAITISI